ncbi:MAG: DNA mismatch repair endonuclease MutL [Alphaproteobacteria bacterium]|nr:DNA mismatch repair endonuclease MutL [Alphaproteobacteria bacterium]
MIRILADAVVDRIAAGEVVERPASVLKELVENALDAGATRLDVALGDGGAALVRVRDDGMGMSADDALLCIERHATSKISDAGDLVGVRTFGFRGEALPSIASVSRFRLTTRRAQDEAGTEVRVDGGSLVHVGPVACPPGTEVEVRSLFHHVPARRKFLRTRQTELAHCTEQLVRQVIWRPGVDVRAVHDGREVLRSPASDDLQARVRDLLGADADALVPVDASLGGIRVHGLVSPVGVHRPSSAGATYTFVRGRFVRDPVVRRGLTEAYRGVVPAGRFPLVVLDVDLEGDEVDVNVHPAKTEVRFRRPAQVIQAVQEALDEALRARRIAPVRGVPLAAEPAGDLFAPEVPDVPVRPPAMPPPLPAVTPSPAAWTAPPAARPPAPAPATTAAPAPMPVPVPAPTAAPAGPTVRAVVDGVALAVEGDALWVVDLVALARTVAAHTLAAQRAAGEVASRALLVPARVTLPRAEASLLVREADALAAVGVELTAFGPGELAVLALPDAWTGGEPQALLEAAARALGRGDDLVDAVVASLVPAPRTADQAQQLLDRGRAALGEGSEPPWRVYAGAALHGLVRGG